MAAGSADELRAQAGESNLEDAFVKLIGAKRGPARMSMMSTLMTVMRRSV